MARMAAQSLGSLSLRSLPYHPPTRAPDPPQHQHHGRHDTTRNTQQPASNMVATIEDVRGSGRVSRSATPACGHPYTWVGSTADAWAGAVDTRPGTTKIQEHPAGCAVLGGYLRPLIRDALHLGRLDGRRLGGCRRHTARNHEDTRTPSRLCRTGWIPAPAHTRCAILVTLGVAPMLLSVISPPCCVSPILFRRRSRRYSR